MLNKSPEIGELAAALAKFQGMMGAIGKDSENPFFKSRYASLSAIIKDTRKALAENGLSYVQFPQGQHGLTTMLMHTSGQYLEETYEMVPTETKPQAIGSALAYMRRYALCSILGLQVEDDDGQEASQQRKQQVSKTTWQRPRVVGTDTDGLDDIVEAPPRPAPKATRKLSEVDAKRTAIVKLVSETVLIPLETKEEYDHYVKQRTGLELTPSNYDAIIERLKVIED